MRPTPVITEEVTASIEEMIQKKIVEVNYLSCADMAWASTIMHSVICVI